MDKKHIVIIAGKGIDRASFMDALKRNIRLPLYGFVTRSTERNELGYHGIYLYRASDTVRENSERNHIGDCNGRDRSVNTRVFTDLGTEYLKAECGSVIIMDELGFMEKGSVDFCDAVMKCLDGDIPVLASAKDMPKVDFLNEITHHPNVHTYELTDENRNELYAELTEIISAWNEQC